jgi:hypothetical protein
MKITSDVNKGLVTVSYTKATKGGKRTLVRVSYKVTPEVAREVEALVERKGEPV